MYEIWRSRSSITFQRPKLDGTQSPVQEAGTPIGRIHSGTVNFKDISIGPEAFELADGDTDEDDRHSEDSTNKSAILLKPPKVPHRTKYVIILVGLPGRGKTFLCNKIKCYLNWLGHQTRHFNVGSYRRLQKGNHEVQNADFFDAHNPAGIEARCRALYAALDDLQAYLYSDAGQVAIFDATNTTKHRRKLLINRFHGRFQYLFIESICTDEKVLEQNYRFKMQYSPDYQGMDMQQSLDDFRARIYKYEEVYEPINDRNIHYIKLIDMVTGRGHMDVNRISGYLPGKIVFFLMQVCKAGMAQARRIWLTRHGESEYNLKHRIGGNTPLAPTGEVYARCLPEMLIERLPLHEDEQTCVPVSVWTSTLCRTIQTARYLPFPKLRWKALDEIQAGACDGLTYEEIKERFPEEFAARRKDKLRYRYPAGESYLDVIQRLEPVIIEMEREKECIVVVGHQAVLRAVLGYFMAKPLESIPTLEVPLHTLVELRPRPDGTMEFEYLPLDPEAIAAMEETMTLGGPSAAGPLGYGSFSSPQSTMRLLPVYSMNRLAQDSPTINTPTGEAEEAGAAYDVEPAPELVVGSALSAAASTAWSLPKGIGRSSSVSLLLGPAVGEGLPADASAVPPVTTPVAVSSPAVSIHSRAPSLASGLGGNAPSSCGNSPSSAFHFALSPTKGAVATAAGDAAASESPLKRAAALAVAVDSRTRKVRVPYGATMGGSGSEGGAPSDHSPSGHLASPLGGGAHSWSPVGLLQRDGKSELLPSLRSETDLGALKLRQMQQPRTPVAEMICSGGGAEEAGEGAEQSGAAVGVGADALAVLQSSTGLGSSVMSLAYLLEGQAPPRRAESTATASPLETLAGLIPGARVGAEDTTGYVCGRSSGSGSD